MDTQEEIYETAKDLGVPGPLARRLATMAAGYEQLAIETIDRLADVPTEAEQSRYVQIKKALNEAMRQAYRQEKDKERDVAHGEMVKQYERGRDKGIVPTREQLEGMILELYNSEEILEYAPRNIPQELREDPTALKAKLLEWGIKGAALVKDMVAAAADDQPADDDIPL